MSNRHAPFERVAVLGTGMIGAAIGMASRAAACTVVGWDPDPSQSATARSRGALDMIAESFDQALVGIDLAVVCAPPVHVERVVADVLVKVPIGVIVTDVTSVKGPIARLAKRHPNLVPGHPMAGGEKHGALHADPGIFQGATWPLCPVESTEESAIDRVETWVRALGAVPLRFDADTHDATVAITSHVPHLVAYALQARAGTAARGDSALPVFELAAGGFHSATRVAASDPDTWADIVIANRWRVAEEIGRLAEALGRLRGALLEGDDAVLREGLRAGRRRLESDPPPR